MIEIYCIVLGRVQGVAYRVYAQDSANELCVTGWVKNLSDGSVEVVAQGSQDDLKTFVEYLHEGSLLSVVESVAVEWKTAHGAYDDFSIQH